MDLTKHEKYCRLSEAENKLCGKRSDIFLDRVVCTCHRGWETKGMERCPVPTQQQAVETPKDPLEELIDTSCYGIQFASNLRQSLREFAEKVRGLQWQ